APYPLLERIRLLVKKSEGEILDENFAEDVTITLRFPVERFTDFEDQLQELSSGKLRPEIVETNEVLVKLDG
ncbi:MAG: hypothetical protein B6I38_11315, partial [Anaerolineaceae bacterium 4572_5.1]